MQQNQSGREWRWGPYSVAVLATAATAGLRVALSYLGIAEETPFFLFVIPVVLGAWAGGLGPGALATVLSAATLAGLFWWSGESAVLPHRLDALLLFILEGLLISGLGEMLQRALRRIERLHSEPFRLMVESVKDYSITFLDPEGRITSWNEGAERLSGFKAPEMIGQHFSRLRTPEDIQAGEPERELEEAAKFGRFQGEGWRVRKDGTRIWVTVVIAALHEESGALRGFAKITRDITERKIAEEQLRAINTRLAASNRELQDFASVASHDLQEPLRKILAFGDRLAQRSRDALGEEGRDFLDRMLNAAQRMQALITDLLAFSRVTTRAQPFQAVDLKVVADEVLSDLETSVEKASAQVEVGELPVIEADPTQMRQLLQNLIGNAIKFRRPDIPPIVRVHAETAGTALRSGNGAGPASAASAGPNGSAQTANLFVQDNGIGFDEKYLDRIFNVFQRLHGRNEYEGTGIGLAVCRKIVERHGGTITAHSTPGQGTTFVATLPLKQTAVSAAASALAAGVALTKSQQEQGDGAYAPASA